MDLFESFGNMANLVQGQIKQDIDVNQVMASEVNGIIDFGLWQETVELQKKFNDKVAPGWNNKSPETIEKFDFWMAILDETVEVLGSRHWKWWKNDKDVGDTDWDNVRVELIDLFHFILSICIQQDSQTIIFQQLVNLEMNKETQRIKDPEFFKDFWDQFLMSVQMKILPLVAVRIVEYWYRIGGDAESLFMEYRIKSALNNIRQEFGYGTTYQKMWVDTRDGTMQEDNVVAWELAQEVPLDKDTIENIEKSLRNYYLEHCAI